MDKIRQYLEGAAEEISSMENPEGFDFESYFLKAGCSSAIAELLSDYFPCACGRAFLLEIGVKVSDTYQRKTVTGEWSAPEKFSDDPLWPVVESFAEEIRTDPQRRKQFSFAAQHSAEVAAISEAINKGMKIEELVGGKVASAFLSPRKN